MDEAALTRNVARAAKALEAAELARRDAIVAAHRGGMSTRAIGRAANLSHTRVRQIVAAAEEAK